MEYFGALNVNKPTGVTSRYVVDLVQRLVRPAKVGHAGTLDPLASGVLVLLVGPATRLIEYVQRMPKRYSGTFLLGCRSETDDVEGEVVDLPDDPRPSLEQLRVAAESLTGDIEQRPPAYSALKVDGRRAYKLARAGKAVELASRPIHVERFDIVEYDYPNVRLAIDCGSGTYVRALGRDLAEAVGTSAVMSGLVREAVGNFRVEEAATLEQIKTEGIEQLLLPALRAVDQLPRSTLNPEHMETLAHGRSLDLPNLDADQEYAAVAPDGRLAALLRCRNDGTWQPVRNFSAIT